MSKVPLEQEAGEPVGSEAAHVVEEARVVAQMLAHRHQRRKVAILLAEFEGTRPRVPNQIHRNRSSASLLFDDAAADVILPVLRSEGDQSERGQQLGPDLFERLVDRLEISAQTGDAVQIRLLNAALKSFHSFQLFGDDVPLLGVALEEEVRQISQLGEEHRRRVCHSRWKWRKSRSGRGGVGAPDLEKSLEEVGGDAALAKQEGADVRGGRPRWLQIAARIIGRQLVAPPKLHRRNQYALHTY